MRVLGRGGVAVLYNAERKHIRNMRFLLEMGVFWGVVISSNKVSRSPIFLFVITKKIVSLLKSTKVILRNQFH